MFEKIQLGIKEYLILIIQKSLLPIQESQDTIIKMIEQEVKKQPCGQCWECAQGIYRTEGYRIWSGKMFCSENCFKLHRFKMSAPDEQYQYFDGEPLQIIKPIK